MNFWSVNLLTFRVLLPNFRWVLICKGKRRVVGPLDTRCLESR